MKEIFAYDTSIAIQPGEQADFAAKAVGAESFNPDPKKVAEFYKVGNSLEKTAQHFKVGKKKIRSILRKEKATVRDPYFAVSQKRSSRAQSVVGDILELYKQGRGLKFIAKKVKLDSRTVRNILTDNGFDIRHVGCRGVGAKNIDRKVENLPDANNKTGNKTGRVQEKSKIKTSQQPTKKSDDAKGKVAPKNVAANEARKEIRAFSKGLRTFLSVYATEDDIRKLNVNFSAEELQRLNEIKRGRGR